MVNTKKNATNSAVENGSKATHEKAKTHGAKSHKTTMSHAEAGHLGGVADHKCRGRECEKPRAAKATHSVAASHSANATNRSTSASHGRANTDWNKDDNNMEWDS